MATGRKTQTRWVRIFLAAVAMAMIGQTRALGDTSGGPACAAYSRSPEASGLPQTFSDSACQWEGRVIRDSGVGLTVPAAGEEARLDALGLGGSRSLRLVHSEDGRISIYGDAASGQASQQSGASSTPLPACSDGAFSTVGMRVVGGYSFSYNGYSAPSNVAASAASALATAFTNASSAVTSCPAARHRGPAARYLGPVASRFANISSSLTCTRPDGYNTVSWLNGPRETLAVTCMWYSSGVLRSSDAAMNRMTAFFTGNVPSGCSGSSDLVGVMTHEAGHTYGLGHADAGSTDHALHANQTMNSLLGPCTTKYRTLGTGDLNGMTALY